MLKVAICCRSSVVEHSLGKGEVESSIPSGSTSLKNISKLAAFAANHDKNYDKTAPSNRVSVRRDKGSAWDGDTLGSTSETTYRDKATVGALFVRFRATFKRLNERKLGQNILALFRAARRRLKPASWPAIMMHG